MESDLGRRAAALICGKDDLRRRAAVVGDLHRRFSRPGVSVEVWCLQWSSLLLLLSRERQSPVRQLFLA